MPYVNIKVTREGGPEGKGPSAEQKADIQAETHAADKAEAKHCSALSVPVLAQV